MWWMKDGDFVNPSFNQRLKFYFSLVLEAILWILSNVIAFNISFISFLAHTVLSFLATIYYSFSVHLLWADNLWFPFPLFLCWLEGDCSFFLEEITILFLHPVTSVKGLFQCLSGTEFKQDPKILLEKCWMQQNQQKITTFNQWPGSSERIDTPWK